MRLIFLVGGRTVVVDVKFAVNVKFVEFDRWQLWTPSRKKKNLLDITILAKFHKGSLLFFLIYFSYCLEKQINQFDILHIGNVLF